MRIYFTKITMSVNVRADGTVTCTVYHFVFSWCTISDRKNIKSVELVPESVRPIF